MLYKRSACSALSVGVSGSAFVVRVRYDGYKVGKEGMGRFG